MRVDFYLITGNTTEAHQGFLLRLIEKIYYKTHPILMKFDSNESCTKWDEILWAYKSTAFIPHTCIDPCLLSIDAPTLKSALVGINLAPHPWIEGPPRIIEIVPDDPVMRQQSRLNYKTYQKQKFDMMVHNLQ